MMEFAAGIGTIIEFVNACEVYIMPRSTFERCTHSSQVWQVVSILDAGNRDVDVMLFENNREFGCDQDYAYAYVH